MRGSGFVCFACLVLVATCAVVEAQDFSVDPLSAEVPTPWSPGDIIFAPGVPVLRAACDVDLGLPAGGDLDAFSYGFDTPLPVDPEAIAIVTYSVTRASLGAAGSVVATEVAGNGSAGDTNVWRSRPPNAVLDRVWMNLD